MNSPAAPPYVRTASLYARRRKRGDVEVTTFAAMIELTPALIAAADVDGFAQVYFAQNTDATPGSRRKPDYIGYVASQPDDDDDDD